MKLPGSRKKKTVFCPRCNSPAPEGTAFCEACGARIGPPPSCSLCGTLLSPGSRFCPSCGTMIGTSKDNLPDASVSPDKDSAPVKKPGVSRVKKPKKTDAEAQVTGPDPLMMIPDEDEPVSPEEAGIPARDSLLTKKVAAPSSLVTIPPQGKRQLFPPGFDRKKASIAAGLLVIIAVAALAFSGLLPIPHAFFSAGNAAPAAPATETPTPAVTETPVLQVTVTTPLPVITPEAVSLVPGPTQVPPANFLVYFQAERDPRTKIVSVQYMGGKGQMGVREVFVRLTRSDGQVLTETFKPIQVGSGIELQGTEKTDRLEVIVRYYAGDEYTVIDKLFEYKIRT